MMYFVFYSCCWAGSVGSFENSIVVESGDPMCKSCKKKEWKMEHSTCKQCKQTPKYIKCTGKMRQLVVVRRICCCSQSMIFLLELLGQAIGCLAGPSSSNRKIMNWEQQQILLSTTNCLILPVCYIYIFFKKAIDNRFVKRICIIYEYR